MMRAAYPVLVVAAVLLSSAAGRGADLAVAVDNRSRPTACAEEDNVYLRLTSAAVRHFRIAAVHPAYVDDLAADATAPDFARCDFADAPPPPSQPVFTPRRVVLYEDDATELIGFTFERFWRTSKVPVRVGARAATDIHLIQLWVKAHGLHEEVLVLYPTDGYWRARPLTPEHLSSSGYGSSFLIGPVEVDDRPLVDLREVVFDPAARAFRLRFARGGAATLRVADVDRARIALDVSFDQPVRGRPFAALRSMFVAEDNADTAWVAWRGTGAAPWRSLPILSFARARAATVRAERIAPSRHNTAAPDVVFGGFRTGP